VFQFSESPMEEVGEHSQITSEIEETSNVTVSSCGSFRSAVAEDLTSTESSQRSSESFDECVFDSRPATPSALNNEHRLQSAEIVLPTIAHLDLNDDVSPDSQNIFILNENGVVAPEVIDLESEGE